MTHLPFALLYLAQLAHGATTNLTSSDRCPPPDGTTRSLWSILGSCALTLFICVWHTVHFNIPRDELEASLWFKVLCAFGSFLAPEVLIAYASREWWKVYETGRNFSDKGYKWSMTHGFFAKMGGFLYSDEQGSMVRVDSKRFLRLCKEHKVRNPFITVRQIKDKSKSDWLGKAILALQLVWFMHQVVVRGSRGLAITLVELDTVCMAVLSLIVIVLWWHKPLRPDCPHVFYSTHEIKHDGSVVDVELLFNPCSRLMSTEDKQKEALSDAWKPQPILPDWLITCFTCTPTKPSDGSISVLSKLMELLSEINYDDEGTNTVMFASLCVTWLILGGLHLIAWDFEFPTEGEKILWRIASLVLAGGSPVFFSVFLVILTDTTWNLNLSERARHVIFYVVWPLAGILGVVSRTVLVGLMLTSLRALPCSAHETVAWTAYIPHL